MAGQTSRTIIEIDEELCDGCGVCVPSCAEGALAVVDGKLRILDEARCDGAGACLGHCPRGALRLVEKTARPFDPSLVEIEAAPRVTLPSGSIAKGCPGSSAMQWHVGGQALASASALRQWPVQLHLLSPSAPFWSSRELLLAADCTAFAAGGFHAQMMTGRSVAIACPKLDDTDGYVDKLAAILSRNDVRALRIAIMEVPCCGALAGLAMQAVREAGYEGEVEAIIFSRIGEVLHRRVLQPDSRTQATSFVPGPQ